MNWLGVLTCAAALTGAEGDDSLGAIGKQVADFSLRDTAGVVHSLSEAPAGKPVVLAFLGVECPLAKLYGPRLAELAAEFRPKGVTFLGISSNRQDSIAELEHYIRSNKLPFPILKDLKNEFADALGAKRTPEVFLLDGERTIRYRGRIDDQYSVGVVRPKVGRRDLAEAIGEVLAGKPVSQPELAAAGCLIGRIGETAPKGEITYAKHIAPILQARCVECHRAGEIGPFAMTSYDDLLGWGEMMREVISAGRMPPWHADPAHGTFRNDSRMPDSEKELIHEWVRNGMPKGDEKDLPPPREFVDGWRIPRPDVVFTMPKPFTVPAQGEVPYKYFTVETNFTEDKWVQFAEARPGNRSVVHHIVIFVMAPGSNRQARFGELSSDWLAATAPGGRPLELPDGMAKYVPAGARIVFQMHYTPNGVEQTDQSKLGIVFADPKKVRQEVVTEKAANSHFQIPPRAADHAVESAHTLRHDTLLLAMFPHMHLRGRSFRYTALYPDQRREVLLDVPRYDFNWQNGYILDTPKRLPKGTTIQCVASFDNSERNLSNPDPSQAVRWGDQTWEEMMIGYFDMAIADQDLTKAIRATRTERFLSRVQKEGLKLDDSVRQTARSAKGSQEAFDQLGVTLKEIFPQLDWIGVTTVRGDNLQVDRSQQVKSSQGRRIKSGLKLSVTGMSLAKYAAGTETVVHSNLLTDSPGYDLKALRENGVQSSLHVPIRFDGQPAVVSFCSGETNAFPQQAVDALEEIAQLLGD